jgi:Zn-dependent metalloprotease
VSTPTIYLYDEALFSDVASNPILVWRFQIDIPGKPISRLYYINALDGSILYSLNNVANALSRETYTLSETPDCNSETLTYDEDTLPVTYETDEAWVHLYAGDAYDYFYNTFGRDSYNDEDPDDATDDGGTIESYTHYRDSEDACSDAFAAGWVNRDTEEPYEFMYFAEGVYGPDIVGHEFAHGVVDYSAQFEYINESGALDESYADIFGTMIEHSTGETDWTIGEDLPTNRPSECTTALRSLEDPTGYTGHCDGSGDALPDHIDDQLELADSEEPLDDNDNGYVHINSSIPNYAFYLLSQGPIQ